MKVEHIFYGVGGFAAICGIVYFAWEIVYFAWEYFDRFTFVEKVSILTFLTVLFLVLGYYFGDRGD